ncbi:MAG: hypothetical protein IPK24_05665 [Kineosporiaceae bacterium]|nr:hypothetical protein [Kineosporiaceae bacterium]
MNDWLTLSLLGAVALVCVVLVMRAGSRSAWSDEVVAYAVTFPRGVTPAQVSAFLTGAAGIVARRWQRPFVIRAVGWEVTATADGIIHHLLMRKIHAATVLSALRAAIPGARVALDERYRPPEVQQAAQLGQSGARRVLADGSAERVRGAVVEPPTARGW